MTQYWAPVFYSFLKKLQGDSRALYTRAPAGNFSGVIFYLTKQGFFQLDPMITAYSSA
jgi:hypothetical protein